MLLIYLVTSLTLGDGHIWHQISVVGIAEGEGPLADYHLSGSKGLQY